MGMWFRSSAAREDYHDYNSSKPNGMKKRQVILKLLSQHGKLNESCGCLLDVGCGNGETTGLLAKHFQRAIGVDPSVGQISEARKLYETQHVEFLTGTGERLPVEDSSVDVITSILALHYMDVEMFIRECKWVLKPSGIMMFYSANISRLISGDDTTLPIIDAPAKAMVRKCYEKCRDLSHPSFNAFEDHKTQFDAMDWINNSRVEMEVESETTLGAWGRFCLSIPVFQEFGSGLENPVIELMQVVKKHWSKEDEDEENIKIKTVYRAVVNVLK